MQNATRRRLDHAVTQSTHGVLTIRDLDAVGLERHAVSRLVRDGHLAQAGTHVYVEHMANNNWMGACATLVVRCGPEAMLSRQAAARLWALDGFTDIEPTPHVNVRVASGARGQTVHRVPQLGAPVLFEGLRVTSVGQTLVELGAELGTARTSGSRVLSAADRVELALECAIHRKLITVEDLQHLVASLPARRAGLPVLAKVLARRPIGPPTESWMETRWAQELRRGAIPNVRRQVEIFDAYGRFIARVDFLIGDNVILEADGFEHHGNRAAFDRDRQRWRELQALGYVVVPVTTRDLQYGPEAILRQIRSLLAKRA